MKKSFGQPASRKEQRQQSQRSGRGFKDEKTKSSTWLISFFIFVVIGSALFQILNIWTKKDY